jgi:hypothetical protein
LPAHAPCGARTTRGTSPQGRHLDVAAAVHTSLRRAQRGETALEIAQRARLVADEAPRHRHHRLHRRQRIGAAMRRLAAERMLGVQPIPKAKLTSAVAQREMQSAEQFPLGERLLEHVQPHARRRLAQRAAGRLRRSLSRGGDQPRALGPCRVGAQRLRHRGDGRGLKELLRQEEARAPAENRCDLCEGS